MSKERLEEIKLKFNNTVDVMLYVPYEDVKFLIEQAERVQELESRIADDEHFVAEILEQNKRYREALEFYADENNYREQELKGIVPPRPITFKPILHDYGSIARQKLEESE